MGGAINIITRKQTEEGWSAGGRMMYGSHNTQKYMANGGMKKNKFDGYLSVNHDRTDGHRANSDFTINNGYAKLGYRANERFRLWGDVSLASYNAQNPGTVARPMLGNIQEILRGVTSVTAENDFGKISGAIKFFYNFGNHKIDDGYAAEGGTPTAFHFRSSDHNYGITFYQSFRPFAGNMMTVGVDYKNFGGHARDEFKDGITPVRNYVDTTAYEIAGYLIVQQTLFNKLTLNAGLRLENSSIFGAEWAPQAGLSYRPHRHTVLKASVSKGFRSPTIRELYYVAPWGAVNNPDLKPERMMNYEFSVGQTFFGGRLSAEITGYIVDGSNIIVAFSDGVSPRPVSMNVGDFNNKGFEFELRWNVIKNLDIKGNYSYLNMKKTVVNAPEQQTYIAATYRLNKWSASANYQYIHGLYLKLEDATPAISENYGLLNARVSYRPLKWLDVFVKGENLANRDYQTFNGYPMPGITVFGGVNMTVKN
jgi:iron complex outermembrane receptor protein